MGDKCPHRPSAAITFLKCHTKTTLLRIGSYFDLETLSLWARLEARSGQPAASRPNTLLVRGQSKAAVQTVAEPQLLQTTIGVALLGHSSSGGSALLGRPHSGHNALRPCLGEAQSAPWPLTYLAAPKVV